MQGYWNTPERTKDTIDRAGWMHTGDLGTMDSDGYCYHRPQQRHGDPCGENIYPRKIEEFLYSHPTVADVHVFGVPDT